MNRVIAQEQNAPPEITSLKQSSALPEDEKFLSPRRGGGPIEEVAAGFPQGGHQIGAMGTSSQPRTENISSSRALAKGGGEKPKRRSYSRKTNLSAEYNLANSIEEEEKIT